MLGKYSHIIGWCTPPATTMVFPKFPGLAVQHHPAILLEACRNPTENGRCWDVVAMAEVQGVRVRPYSRAPPKCHKSWGINIMNHESHRISPIDLHQSRTPTREPRIPDSPTPNWQTRNAPWCCAWQPLPCSEPALAKGFGMLKDDNAGLDLNHATGTLLQNKSCWDLRGESPTWQGRKPNQLILDL